MNAKLKSLTIHKFNKKIFFDFLFDTDNKYKKRVCNSFTVSKRNTGWIAIDVEQVIRQWEKAYRSNITNHVADPMLMIDVEDQDKVPLRAGTFFQASDCQACKCAVFRFYLSSNTKIIYLKNYFVLFIYLST